MMQNVRIKLKVFAIFAPFGFPAGGGLRPNQTKETVRRVNLSRQSAWRPVG
jgi:hypothetical protein